MSDNVRPDWYAERANAIDALAAFARETVGAGATVDRGEFSGAGIPTLSVAPINPHARSVDVLGEQSLVVQLGENGGRWELGYESADLALARALIESAVAGRIVQRFALARSRVTATLADGRVIQQTGYNGCLSVLVPLPGWTRWGRLVEYEPYRDTTLRS